MSDLTIQSGGVWQNVSKAAAEIPGNEKQGEKKNYFAGDLNLISDPIAQKRKEAQEKAWSVVENAWKNDSAVDEMIDSRKKHAVEMETWKKERQQELSGIEDDKKVLKELYEIADGSEEQKNLELLEKWQDNKNGVSHEALTEDEQKRLEELFGQPLTEYQERALELNERAGVCKKDIAQADLQMRDADNDVRSIQRERLKSDPMLKAQKQAEAIKESANNEIIGMLVEEATEHIDEVMEDAQEKAEETANEKEEREEHLEELKEQRKLQEAVAEGTKQAVEEARAEQRRNDAPDIQMKEMLDITTGSSKVDEVQNELDEIKNNMKLLAADLKGIKVDEEI